MNDVDTQLKDHPNTQNNVTKNARRLTWWLVVLYGVAVSIKVILVIWMVVNRWG